ncbi:hypothetical protein [Mycolicibacterium brisbanense]|uniref:DUF4386 family protein n=1 Tax=Mycolicibacterium brisbanense TaxID=146020 RepID=A0A124E154_9MYCO|nr:hypothetical protein [Mycolicibacterium brisbanense]MCV7157962.1 hypothetical protein [Mycolicibacterium brisbanense]GAS92610.1 uncharacterized protein RMCB_6706 [Mycolicibacterium brisbanense]
MNTRAQWISLWITPFFAGLLLAALIAFPGFWPPMSPNLSAEQVAEFYRHNGAMVRFSMITVNLCAIMLVPFFMVIVVQMKRMATSSHVLAYCYLAAAANGATLLAIADIFWLVAAFRPERNPQLTQLLNDLAWLVFIAPVGMVVVANLCLALAVWLDARTPPVFPRWVAPFSLVTAAAMAPAACAVVFRTGPLAWDGAISFWLRNSAFVLYVAVMFVVVRSAIAGQAAESSTEPAI